MHTLLHKMLIGVLSLSTGLARPAAGLMLRSSAVRRLATVRMMSADAGGGGESSVTGVVYTASAERPTVQLFTKAGCTLCDVAKGVLADAAIARPHTLEAVDITDTEHAEWWDRYKYDIPVLHIDNAYWAKHRITLDETLEALDEAEQGAFAPRRGEPDAGRLERPK